jgi:CheY-like chemotaxis protein/HPt (histidine-containing phosphotransfer) domain-containing protein
MPGVGGSARRHTMAGVGLGESFTVARDSLAELARLKTELARAEATIKGYLGMAHELRTLVSGMTGLSTMLLESDLDEDQRHRAQLLRSSSTAMIDLVNDLLDWGKLESGTVEVDRVDFEPRRKLEEVADLVAARARDKRLHLVCVVDEDVPHTVSGDAVRLRQVLLNFAVNAVKYTDRGTVVLRARLEPGERDGDASQVWVRFEVADTGRGVPEEARERIFEPFQQADVATAAKVGGTGLGLAISKGLVEAMGGQVGCQANEGKGSVFYAVLPLRARRSKQRSTLGRVDLSDKRALVVDEDAMTRAELARMLETLGIQTSQAASLDEARSLVRPGATDGAFDVVVCGHVWSDAAQAEPSLEALSAGKSTRVVVVGYPDETLPAPARALAGARVPRPVREAQLVGAVAGLFTSSEEKAHGSHERQARGTGSASSRASREEPERPRVLLVEDDAVNAKVTSYLLQKRGLEVDHAVDALEGVEKSGARTYALIFMDLHTPRMDGLEATRRIRSREGEARRTPILAMTAMAIDGTKEQCLAAGMDEYLTKPVVAEALDAALQRFLPSHARGAQHGARRRSSQRVPTQPKPTAEPAPGEAEVPRIDVEAFRAVAALGKPGSTAMARELVEMLGSALPKRIAELEEGSRGGDARRVERAAHSIKGMALQVGATRLGKQAGALEQAARAGDLGSLGERVTTVGREAQIALRLLAQELDVLEAQPH